MARVVEQSVHSRREQSVEPGQHFLHLREPQVHKHKHLNHQFSKILGALYNCILHTSVCFLCYIFYKHTTVYYNYTQFKLCVVCVLLTLKSSCLSFSATCLTSSSMHLRLLSLGQSLYLWFPISSATFPLATRIHQFITRAHTTHTLHLPYL